MPVLIVYLLTLIVWQDLWVIFSLIVLICLPLASYILVKDVKLDTREMSQNKILKEENEKNLKAQSTTDVTEKKRKTSEKKPKKAPIKKKAKKVSKK